MNKTLATNSRRGPAAAKRERGVVLPMVIFALAIMGVLVVTMLSTGGDDKQGSLSQQEGTRSFYAAEAGLNNVLATWTVQQYDTLVPNPGNSADLGWQTLPENRSTYRAVIQRLANGGIYPITLTVDGRSVAPRSGLRTISVLLMAQPRFKDAIFGKGSVSMGGGSMTNSYDSDSAAYSPGTALHNGDVGSNGTITLSGGPTYVWGDATAGGVVSNPARASGTSTNSAPPVTVADVSCPAGGYTPASGVPSGAGISYNAATGDLSVNAGANLTLPVPPNSYYFHDISLTGNGTLTLAPAVTQHVDLFISGALSASGGSIANAAGKPTALTIYGCGNSVANWSISGGTASYYAIYAPNHPLAIGGGSDLYGAFVAGSVSVSGGAPIHYDEALGHSSVFTLVPGSWTEISR